MTEFDVDTDYLDRFEIHQVGGRKTPGYGIPAEGIDNFNRSIVGQIWVVDRSSADDSSP